MIEWLGIGHLFELTRTEALAGFFTPLAIFAVFLLALWDGRAQELSFFNGRFDERFCAEKYGAEKWAEYRARVKYRIFPGVY